jgi:hypothetical protein
MNHYAYCLGDPVNRVDPSGLVSVANRCDRLQVGLTGAVEYFAGQFLVAVSTGLVMSGGLSMLYVGRRVPLLGEVVERPVAGMAITAGIQLEVPAALITADGLDRLKVAVHGKSNSTTLEDLGSAVNKKDAKKAAQIVGETMARGFVPDKLDQALVGMEEYLSEPEEAY